MQLDAVTFGETMVLFSAPRMLPLEYVHQFDKQIGGAESNVAIGLRRLGHSVGWFSKLGNDPFGRYVHKFIRGEGVDTSRCQYTDEAPQSVFFKERLSPKEINVYYYRKDAAASRLSPEDMDEAYISQAKVLHLTGITPALSESCREAVWKAIEIAKRHRMIIVFDPNIRLKLWSKDEARAVLTEIAREADVILPGMDEGELLTGCTTPESVAEAFRVRDDQLVVIKLGEKGAYYHASHAKGYVPGFQVEQVVDPIGAGDGFAAGIISGLLRNEPLEDAVRRANAVGAMVVGSSGDVEGLPTDEQVRRFMSGNGVTQDVKR